MYEKHKQAFEGFAARVKDNPNVIGLLIYSGVAYGLLQESNDINVLVLVRDGSVMDPKPSFLEHRVNEDGVIIGVWLVQVSKFKQRMQTMIAGDRTLSRYSNGILMHCKDDSLARFYEDARKIGKNDVALGIIRNVGHIICEMNRAGKWITALDDTLYAQYFIQRTRILIAEIVLLLNGEHPNRESCPRATELNPAIMQEVYVKAGTTAMTKEEIADTLQVLDAYITELMPLWSKPLLTYLGDGESKTEADCNAYFGFPVEVWGYLVSKGVVQKVPRAAKVFRNSKLMLEEPAYISTGKNLLPVGRILRPTEVSQLTQREKHMQAFESFAARIKDNPNVIGFLISGSLAYGTVTETSDIDLSIFVRDGSLVNSKAEYAEYNAYEDGIEIHPAFLQVSKFKARMQRMIAGDWTLSMYSKGVLKYCKDESLTSFMENAKKVGANDAALGLLRCIGLLSREMRHAARWAAEGDTFHAQHFLQRAGLWAAEAVMLLHGEHPDRESKPRAMELNPALMHEIYVKTSTTAMTKQEVEHTLRVLDAFIMEHRTLWSKPLLAFLCDGESKTAARCHSYFGFEIDVWGYLEDVVTMVPRATKIFRNSKFMLEEVAYTVTV